MPEALVIEVADVTAGIIVGRRGDYRFFSSHPAFDALDGRTFRDANSANRAARDRYTSRFRPAAAPDAEERARPAA